MAELKAARLDVQLRMETVKDKQKSAYDSRHRDAQYQPDDLVLVYTPFRIVKRADRSLWSVRRHPSTTRCRCVQGGISPIQGRSTKRDEKCNSFVDFFSTLRTPYNIKLEGFRNYPLQRNCLSPCHRIVAEPFYTQIKMYLSAL